MVTCLSAKPNIGSFIEQKGIPAEPDRRQAHHVSAKESYDKGGCRLGVYFPANLYTYKIHVVIHGLPQHPQGQHPKAPCTSQRTFQAADRHFWCPFWLGKKYEGEIQCCSLPQVQANFRVHPVSPYPVDVLITFSLSKPALLPPCVLLIWLTAESFSKHQA